MKGSKVNIWKQDPSVTKIGIRTSFIHTEIKKGPKDKWIHIKGMPVVTPDPNNDFLILPQNDSQAFDAVHTFSVVRQVLTMYTRGLKRLGVSKAFKWQWGRAALKVYPRFAEEQNAYYNRNNKTLTFGYFFDDDGNLIYTCRSFDIVAHEAGHAILDALRPGYLDNSWHPQTGGLHESFGDLTAIFTMLSQMDICETIVAESKLDLHARNFISTIAEQFGNAVNGHSRGLRNAINDLKLSDVTTRVHDISRVFTGAIYDIIVELFNAHLDLEHYDPAETLFRVGRFVLSYLIVAILRGPENNATFKDIAIQMIEIIEDDQWKKIAKSQFTKREILGGRIAMAGIQPQELDWSNCSHTLQSKEYQQSFKKTLRKALKAK